MKLVRAHGFFARSLALEIGGALGEGFWGGDDPMGELRALGMYFAAFAAISWARISTDFVRGLEVEVDILIYQ